MKFLKGQNLLIVVLLGSVIPMQMYAGGTFQNNLKRWWRSTYFTDYLPQRIQSLIPRARVRQMFRGVVSYSEKIRELWLSCDNFKMNRLVKNYTQWMQQYRGVINEGTILFGRSIESGIPDSVLGVWKQIFVMYYGIDKENRCLLSGIAKIIKNLENMGAKVNPSEQATLAGVSELEAQF